MDNLENIKNEIVEGAATKAAETAQVAIEEKAAEMTKSVEGLNDNFTTLQKSVDELKETMSSKGTFGIGKNRSEFATKLQDAASDYRAKGTAQLELDMKTFTAGAGPAGQIYGDSRVADIKYDPNHGNRLRDVLMTGSAGSNGSIRYNQETTTTPNAGSKAKGAAQAAAVKTITDRQVAIQTLSIFHTLPEEWLDDTAMLESYFSTRFMGDLMDAEDDNILRGNPGSGAAGSLTAATAYEGINSNSGYTTASQANFETVFGTSWADQFGTVSATNLGANRYDALTAAASVLARNNFTATLAVLHPDDYYLMSLIKATTGEYVLQQTALPDGTIAEFWRGMRVIKSTAQAAGTFTVLDSNKSTQYWVREGLNIQFDRNANDFQTNSISVRGIIRGNVTNYLPNGIITGTFANAIAALNDA